MIGTTDNRYGLISSFFQRGIDINSYCSLAGGVERKGEKKGDYYLNK